MEGIACSISWMDVYISYIVVLEQNVEAQAKSNDKDKHDDEELEHGVADVSEHEDEDAEGGKLLEVGEQVESGRGQDERPNRPSPALPCKEI